MRRSEPEVTQTVLPSGANTTSWARNGGAIVCSNSGRRGLPLSSTAIAVAAVPSDVQSVRPSMLTADVPSGAGNPGTGKDPPANGVDRDDFLRRRVGDVHEIGARMDSGVPGRFESVQLGSDLARNRVDHGDEAVVGVRHDRSPPVDGLDATRARGGADPGRSFFPSRAPPGRRGSPGRLSRTQHLIRPGVRRTPADRTRGSARRRPSP